MGNPDIPKQRETAETRLGDPNIALMEKMGMENVLQTRKAQAGGQIDTVYKAKIDKQNYQLNLTENDKEIQMLASREVDSVMFSEKIAKNGNNEFLKSGLLKILQQIKDKHYKEQVEAEFKKAQAVADRSPTTGEVVQGILAEPVTAMAVMMAVSSAAPEAFNVSKSQYPSTIRNDEYGIPSPRQAQNIEMATQASKVKKEAKDQMALVAELKRDDAIRKDWSYEYSALGPSTVGEPMIMETMKKNGIEGVDIIYSQEEAMKKIHFSEGDRDVSFSILPGGTIVYEVRHLVEDAVNKKLGHAIKIIDNRYGGFQASSLDAAIKRLKVEILLSLNEERKFIYSDVPGLAPTDVTGSQELEQYALPYPVVVSIPTKDEKIKLPLDAKEARAFIYIPIAENAVIPLQTNTEWYEFGKSMERRKAEKRKKAN